MGHQLSHVRRHAMLRVHSLQYDSDVYDGLRLNGGGSPPIWTLREVLTVLVATCSHLGNAAMRFRLSPHTPCQAAVAICPNRRTCFWQCGTRTSRSQANNVQIAH